MTPHAYRVAFILLAYGTALALLFIAFTATL